MVASLLRMPATRSRNADVARTASHPERLHHLIALIEDGLGYALYQAVSSAKAALSSAEQAELSFQHKDFVVNRLITRSAFEGWIAPDLTRLGATVDQALKDAALAPDAVDKVFLTGGTSFVPAVSQLFVNRFGTERIESGGELLSIAHGLSLIGESKDIEQWVA